MLPKGPYNPQSTEEEILKFWLDGNYYSPEYKNENKLSTASKSDRETFTIILPPPNANGNLHLGHMSGYAYQDLMGRFERMRGKEVLLLPGKDHAGIQTEVVFERELEKKGKSKQIIGREKFYELCYDFCMKNAENARNQEKRIGLSADFDRELFTLDPKIVDEVMEAFELMYKDGLVYRDKRIINWCVRCQSALADIDTEFKDSTTPFFYFKYPFLEPDQKALELKKKWQGKDVDWVFERDKTLDGKNKLPFSFGKLDQTEVIAIGYSDLEPGQTQSGIVIGIQMRLDSNYRIVVVSENFDGDLKTELNEIFTFEATYYAGAHVILFDEYPEDIFYTNGFILGTVRPETKFGDTALAVNPDDERYKEFVGKEFEVMTLNGPTKINIIGDKAVNKEEGTGMLKVTPAHSVEDWEIANRHTEEAMPEKQVIDFNGKLNHLTGKYEDMNIKEARKAMIEDLKEAGTLVYLDQEYKNRIRICERCKHPVEPLISYQWFVDTKPLKAEAKRLVEEGFTEIMPEGKKKTYMQWMNTPEDWCITRQLWWGYRLPVWYKGKREQYVTETGEVKEKIAGKVIESKKDYQDLLYVGKNNPESPKIFLIPGKHVYAKRKLFPDLRKKYPNTVELDVNNPEDPTYQDYIETFSKHDFKDQIIVTHSRGGSAIKRYLVENSIPVKKLIMLAIPSSIREKYVGTHSEEFYKPIDDEKFSSLVEEMIFIHSDNDELISLEDVENTYKNKFPNAKFYVEHDKGHYAEEERDESSEKLEEVLDNLYSGKTQKLTFIRHGETDQNVEARWIGRTDPDLSENGRQKAKELAEEISKDFDVIITSPLKRAKETAEILNSELNVELIENDLLMERDFGNLENKTWSEFKAEFPEEAAKNNPSFQANLDKGESIEQVEARVEKFIDWLTMQGFKNPLIATHAGIIRVLERKLNNETPEESRGNDPENLEIRKYEVSVEKWQQDEDVLDTWFSSGQWPYVTLMAQEGDYDKYYPTQVMETGWDILLFWVTRMMLLNPYRAKKKNPDATDEKIAPFKNVYLHGLVLDKNGIKMSKSKGNGIDPFEMMQKYGTDALRFSFVKGNSVGQNYRLYEEKIASNRNFCNKIWNASKFAMFNFEDVADKLPELKREDLSFEKEDEEFLEHINKLVEDTTRRLEEFQFGVAAEELYSSFWATFADIYIEQVKTRLYTKDKEGNAINTSEEAQKSRLAGQWTLYYALEAYLKLLHPFIPFVTEAIWQKMPKHQEEAESIMYSKWPN